MNEQLELALCVVKVLALIIIASSVYKIANPYSYFRSAGAKDSVVQANLSAPNMRVTGTVLSDGIAGGAVVPDKYADSLQYFMGDGQYESPSFWNIGSLRDIRDARNVASTTGGSVTSNKAAVLARLNANNYVGTASEQGKAREMDEYAAQVLGLVQNASGKWVEGGNEYFSERNLELALHSQ